MDQTYRKTISPYHLMTKTRLREKISVQILNHFSTHNDKMEIIFPCKILEASMLFHILLQLLQIQLVELEFKLNFHKSWKYSNFLYCCDFWSIWPILAWGSFNKKIPQFCYLSAQIFNITSNPEVDSILNEFLFLLVSDKILIDNWEPSRQ